MSNTTTKEPTQPIQVEFEPGREQNVQIELDERAKRKLRNREKLAERAAYERMGVRVLRLKANTYKMLKKQIDQIGIKTIGHCSIMIARDKAESVVAELDAIAQQWDEEGADVQPEVRIHLQQLKLDCIKIMVDSGAEHLRAERQPSEPQSGKGIQLPFEAGMPTAIFYGKPPGQIEGGDSPG